MSVSVSLQKSTKRTNIKHNNREMSEKEKAKNSHIDYNKSDENVYLVKKDIREIYEQEFGQALEAYNAKQKRNDRKIDDYYKHIEASKKTSTQQEMIVQIGDKDDFENDESREQATEILAKWVEGFEERNPNLKIYNAVIHNDEASTHLHLNFVPVAEGYQRGLEKQVAFDKAIIQQDDTLDKNRPFDGWREGEVKELEKLLNERNIERKYVGKNNYKDVNEYKTEKDKELEHEKNVKREFDELYAETKHYEKPMSVLAQVEENKRKSRIGSNVILKEDDYKSVLDIAVRGASAMNKLSNMQDKIDKAKESEKRERQFVQEQSKMQAEKQQQQQRILQLQQQLQRERAEREETERERSKIASEAKVLKNENTTLKNENTGLKGVIKDLKTNADKFKETMYDKIRDCYKVIVDNSVALNMFKGDSRYVKNLDNRQHETLKSITETNVKFLVSEQQPNAAKRAYMKCDVPESILKNLDKQYHPDYVPPVQPVQPVRKRQENIKKSKPKSNDIGLDL